MKSSRLAVATLTFLSVSTPAEGVVGGTNANAAEFPSFVQGYGCGASLIWYDMALSSALCAGSPFDHTEVYIGNVMINNETDGVIRRNVAQQVPHPNWNRSTLENNYLLLKLNEEVPRNHSFIRPIELNNVTSIPAARDPLTIIGFGFTNVSQPKYATRLQKSTLYACGTYPDLLCASAPNKSWCFGDDGGPLIDARGVQVGVTSDGPPCNGKSYFAPVSSAYIWIRSQICSLASNPPANCPTVILTNSTIVEGDSTTITLSSQELGPLMGRVDWGDGTVDVGTNASFTHKYLNGTANYTIKTNFSHSALPTSKQYKEFSVRVNNAAPSIVLSGIPNTTQMVPYNATVFITCSDAGVLDTQTISVHWNDSSANDKRTVSAPASVHCKNLTFWHLYTKVGTFAIRAVVKDSGGTFSNLASSTLVTVSGRRGLLRGADDVHQDKN